MKLMDDAEIDQIINNMVKNSKDPLFVKDPQLASLSLHYIFEKLKQCDFDEEKFDFNQEEFQEIISSFLDYSSNEFLKDIIPEELERLRQFRLDQDHLKFKIREIWGEALDLLEILYLMSYEIGSNLNREEQKSPNSNQDYVFIALTHLHGKACQTFFEIIILLENGFASGANARWRTLDEIAVIAFFIRKHGQTIAKRYLDHSHIDSHKAMVQYNDHADRLGFEKNSEEEIQKIRSICLKLEEEYGKEFKEKFGWASPAILTKSGKPNPNPDFSTLKNDVKLEHLKPYYKMASYAVHADSKGILFNISYRPEERVIPSGSSIFGLADPGQLAAISLIHVNTALLVSKPMVMRMTYAVAMQKLLKDIKNAFFKSHVFLEESQYQDQN
jgi:hypothetical protein